MPSSLYPLAAITIALVASAVRLGWAVRVALLGGLLVAVPVRAQEPPAECKQEQPVLVAAVPLLVPDARGLSDGDAIGSSPGLQVVQEQPESAGDAGLAGGAGPATSGHGSPLPDAGIAPKEASTVATPQASQPVQALPLIPPACTDCARHLLVTAQGKGWPTWATVVIGITGGGLFLVDRLWTLGVIR